MSEKITAVVVTRNRVQLLQRCLLSLLNQTYKLSEIVIIDNASTDDTKKFLKHFKDECSISVTCHFMEKNVGGAGGFSCGMKIAMNGNPDWVMLLDDDAEPKPDYLNELMKFHIKYPDCGCFIGTEFVGNTEQRAYGGRRRIINKRNLREECAKEEEYSQPVFSIDTAVFVGFTVKKNIIEKVGYPDADFFIYYDDTDYSLRIRDYSEILCVPSARINHRTDFKKDILEEGQKEWRRLYLFRNKLVIKKRYIKGKINCNVSMFLSLFHEVLHIVKNSNRSGISSSKYKKIKNIIKTYNDACHNKLGEIPYVLEN